MKKRYFTGMAFAALAVMLAWGTAGRLEAQAATETAADETEAYSITVPDVSVDGDTVTMQIHASGLPDTDDGFWHILAQECYESGTEGEEVALVKESEGDTTVELPLGENTENSLLFKKLSVAGVQNGKMKQFSGARYITNPEDTAATAAERSDGSGKKGMLLSADLTGHVEYLQDLGIDQITYDLPIGNLMTDATTGFEEFTYNGKTYQISNHVTEQYDNIVTLMNNLDISVTLILLNNMTSDTALIHPKALGEIPDDGSKTYYYAFNTANEEGTEQLEAIAAYLGQRYSGAHGTVDNWIVGNEVNARKEWCYIDKSVGEDYAAQCYEDAVRIFYNGILSQNSSARVFVCIDHEWDVSDGVPKSNHYTGKSFLDRVIADANAEGNYGYGLATHPFNVPLFDSKTWEPTIENSVTYDENTDYITMANIDVLTDYMCESSRRQPDGEVRPILLSEVGYTSMPSHGYDQNEDTQSAAIAYGMLQTLNNQYIDGFFTREQDEPEEIAKLTVGEPDNLAIGLLSTQDGVTYTPKKAYYTYKYIDDPEKQAAIVQEAGAAVGRDLYAMVRAR